jgi:large subunit ribosomal protein L15
MNLNEVNGSVKRAKRRKRVGRGSGSGHGKTSGRGHKGQGQLAGWTAHPTFQGGAMPMVRRIPKRGFNNAFAVKVASVNVDTLEAEFGSGEEVTPETLKQRHLIGRCDVVKILGNGELKKKLNVTAHRFSQTALDKIAQAGGSTTVLPGPKPVVRNKQRSAAR